jgi:hypothetical protein
VIAMSDHDGLTQDELDAERGEPLPEREAMSILPIGDPGAMTATPLPIDHMPADHIATDEIHDPQTPPF